MVFSLGAFRTLDCDSESVCRCLCSAWGSRLAAGCFDVGKTACSLYQRLDEQADVDDERKSHTCGGRSAAGFADSPLRCDGA